MASVRFLTSVRFLAWLGDRDQAITTVRQVDLDRYPVTYPGRATALVLFVTWTASTAGHLSGHDQWAQVELLLHDDTIRLYTRIAGLFTLLLAQPLSRICRMCADQITHHAGGRVTVTFDTFP